MTRFLPGGLALLVLLAACSKSEPDPEPAGTYNPTDFMGTWKLAARSSAEPYHWGGSATATTNVLSGSAACGLNASFDLQINGVANISWCGSNSNYGQWQLSGKTFRYRMDTLSSFQSETVTAKTATSFTTTYSTVPPTGTGSTLVTSTYRKQ